ncbi:MAG: hypothetical protein QMD32_05710, partial [Smithellaceae bacterium]|nr:hypothetical protein [Smithellaceae bacterium]
MDPRWIDLGSSTTGDKITGQIRIRNAGKEILRWTASIPSSPPKAAEERVKGGRFLSLQNQEVRATGIYLPPRHLRDQIEVTGKWTEEEGYPFGLSPHSSLRFRFSGTGISLINLRRSPGGTMTVLIDDQPLVTGVDQQDENRNNDPYQIEGLPDGPHILTITSRDGTVLMEGVRIYGR